MYAFYFSIGIGVVAMRSFEDDVEIVVKHAAKFCIAGEGPIFISSYCYYGMTLTEEGGDEKTDKIERSSFACSREYPWV